MTVTVVAWNIAHKPGAWRLLDDELQPDVALLTEACVPQGRSGVWRPETTGRDGGVRPWSAAMVSRYASQEITDAVASWRGHARHVPFVCTRPGAWVAAQVNTPSLAVTAVSLYGLLDEFSDASMHRSLSELAPLIDDSRYNRYLIIGGDFNTSTQWPDEHWSRRDANVLERFESWGLTDCVTARRPAGRLDGCPCLFGDDCRHVRTRFDTRSALTHIDYLFVSKPLLDRLESCEVFAEPPFCGPATTAVSDHAPIVAKFR